MKRLFLILLLLATPGFTEEDAATKLLTQHGWKVEKEEPSSTLDVPDNFKGLPWFHYQQASRDAGCDLTPVAGKKVSFRSFLLQERGAQEGSKIWAAVVMDKEKVVGVWLHTDAPVAPGIFSLNDHRFPAYL